jgi:hypothetical protein
MADVERERNQKVNVNVLNLNWQLFCSSASSGYNLAGRQWHFRVDDACFSEYRDSPNLEITRLDSRLGLVQAKRL